MEREKDPHLLDLKYLRTAQVIVNGMCVRELEKTYIQNSFWFMSAEQGKLVLAGLGKEEISASGHLALQAATEPLSLVPSLPSLHFAVDLTSGAPGLQDPGRPGF